MTAEEEAALRAKISEAESAYHSLLTGRLPRVVVDQNGERLEFVAANRQGLYTYIQDLKAQLPGTVGNNFVRPIGFLF